MDTMLRTDEANVELSHLAKLSLPSESNMAEDQGCTATVALVTKTEIICANAGDSRTIIVKNGKSTDLSVDHKPENPGERRRVEKAGGFVEDDRVDGMINLSRSLGDLNFKNTPGL